MSVQHSDDERLFSVAFDLEPESPKWPPFSVERIWVRKTRISKEVEICNIPFYVTGLAYGDIVRAEPDHERRELVFAGLVREGGHSTMQVLLRNVSSIDVKREIVRLGCAWEASNIPDYIAIDVPPMTNFNMVRQCLIEWRSGGILSFEESCISGRHRARLEL